MLPGSSQPTTKSPPTLISDHRGHPSHHATNLNTESGLRNEPHTLGMPTSGIGLIPCPHQGQLLVLGSRRKSFLIGEVHLFLKSIVIGFDFSRQPHWMYHDVVSPLHTRRELISRWMLSHWCGPIVALGMDKVWIGRLYLWWIELLSFGLMHHGA